MYERTSVSIEPLQICTEEWFSALSASNHKSAAAFGIPRFALHWVHCLIKKCRWINGNFSCSIRMRSALRFASWRSEPEQDALSGLRNQFLLFLAPRDSSPLMKYHGILTLGIPLYWQHWHVKIEIHKPLLRTVRCDWLDIQLTDAPRLFTVISPGNDLVGITVWSGCISLFTAN